MIDDNLEPPKKFHIIDLSGDEEKQTGSTSILFRCPIATRDLIHETQKKLTEESGNRHTMSDVIRLAVTEYAKKKRVRSRR